MTNLAWPLALSDLDDILGSPARCEPTGELMSEPLDPERLDSGRGYLSDYLYDEDWHGANSEAWFQELSELVDVLPDDDPLVPRITTYLQPFLDDDDRIDGLMYPGGSAVAYIEAGWGGDQRAYLESFVDALAQDYEQWLALVAEFGDSLPRQAGGVGLDAPLSDIDWVSKSDVTTYLRCPYTYSLLAQGKVSRNDVFSLVGEYLLSEGIEFEDEVDAAATPIAPEDVAPSLQAGATVLNTGMYVNESLGLRGIPDGLEGPDLVPIEIKLHRKVRPSDRIELAFYWLLLDPYRSSDGGSPRGIVILRDGEGGEHRADVDLKKDDFDTVHRLIAEVRAARVEPVSPQVCDCYVCSVVRADEVRRATLAAQHPTLIFEISRSRFERLSQLGLETHEQLLNHRAEDIADEFCFTDRLVSPAVVRRWQQHARSYQLNQPVLFGEPLLMPESYIVLDLEYLTYPHDRMWLAGLLPVVDGHVGEIEQFWADDNDDSERALLDALGRWLDLQPKLPMVNWNGKSADFPQMRRAANRLGVEDPLASRECMDLYFWARDNLRLPVRGLGLKDVAEYFEIGHHGPVKDGWDAAVAYQILQVGRTAHATKSELLDYNRSDLQATLALLERLQGLTGAPDLVTGTDPLPNPSPEPIVVDWDLGM